MSLLTVLVRLPNYDFFPLELVLIPELTVFHVKGRIEDSLCKHGHSGLSKVQMRLVSKGRELRDEELLVDCNIEEGSTLEIIIKMQLFSDEEEEEKEGDEEADERGGGRRSTSNNSTTHLPFDICEYKDFVRRVSPEDGARDVKVDASIQVIFGASNIGLQICTQSLIDSSNWLPMHEQGSKSGDMVKQLGGMTEAQRRGFVQWWSKQEEDFSHQRVFLLKLDTDTFSVPLSFPSSSSASCYSTTTDSFSLAGDEEGEEAAYRQKQLQRLHRLIDTKRYWWRGVNKGYSGGDFNSWQRYTKVPPIEVSISERIGTGVSVSFDSTPPLSAALRIGGDGSHEGELIGNQHLNTSLAYTISDDYASCKCLTITPRFPLDYDTTYVLLLANNVPTLPVAACEATWAAFAASVKVVGEDRLFIFHTQKLEAFVEEEEEEEA